jgi:hypothetical protein
MNRRNGGVLGVAGIIGILASGCLAQIEDEDAADTILAEAESALDTTNALTMNALTMNALTMNALTMNALTMNALTPTNLSAIQSATPTGDLSRQLLRYTVGCALDSTQSFSFSWTDSSGITRNETYWGSLGLAPSWATRALTGSAQEWISACLASRTNWYGTSVMLSFRGGTPRLNKSGTSEMTTYTMNEGAFWGNLFASTPYVYACHYGPNKAYSRSQSRDCAAGHLLTDGSIAECGMIEIVGACESVCEPMTEQGKFYPSCTAPGGDANTAVITTFLM